MTIQEIKFDPEKFYFFIFKHQDYHAEDVTNIATQLERNYPTKTLKLLKKEIDEFLEKENPST